MFVMRRTHPPYDLSPTTQTVDPRSVGNSQQERVCAALSTSSMRFRGCAAGVPSALTTVAAVVGTSRIAAAASPLHRCHRYGRRWRGRVARLRP